MTTLTCRSSAGNGKSGSVDNKDPRIGRCLEKSDVIHLQHYISVEKWLTGARNDSALLVGTKRKFVTPNEWTTHDKSYERIVFGTEATA